MRQVDWQTALKLKTGQIRHPLHLGGQIKSPIGCFLYLCTRVDANLKHTKQKSLTWNAEFVECW